MSSRMDRYYRTNSNVKSRAIKNEELYRTIYDVGEYTNIEGIASIEKTNQIDLTQIQELLRSVEQKEKPIKTEPAFEKRETTSVGLAIMDEEEKVYDIRDVLNKAKTERGDVPRDYRQLNNTQYDILKKIKLDEPVEEQELKELIHTITNTSMLNKLEDRELSLNLLSSLQAGEETMVREQETLIGNEKIDDNNLDATINNIDKSFFTSSLNFSNEDFEDLRDIKKDLKKNNFLMIALTVLLIGVIISVIGYIIYTIYG